MKIVGFNSGHDAAYGVVVNGVPVLHNELERFTREKHARGDAVRFFLENEKETDAEMYVHVYDDWRGGIRARYPESFDKIKDKFFEVGHHHAHAANAFYSSRFDRALIITVDGGGLERSDESYNVPPTEFLRSALCVWEGKGTDINPIFKFRKSHFNIGGFWSACVHEIFGLGTCIHPEGDQSGTVMAMAAFGNPFRYINELDVDAVDAPLHIDFDRLKKVVNESQSNRFNMAASLQQRTEEKFRDLISKYKGDHDTLCLSGGVSLNCVMVGKIQKWFPQFKHIWCDPVPYDAGLALGGPRLYYHHILKNPRLARYDHSYLGPQYSHSDIFEAIYSAGLTEKVIAASDDSMTDKLIDKKIVSIFNGRSESGRRALGNRSILADPRHADMKDVINKKVKHRESFRPFAPSILTDHVNYWFQELNLNSPFMSTVGTFHHHRMAEVPAVTHIDGSARLHTVDSYRNAWFYKFILRFHRKTGVPMLLNTSFNDREPIVETPRHAIECFLKTEIDYLYFPEHKIAITK